MKPNLPHLHLLHRIITNNFPPNALNAYRREDPKSNNKKLIKIIKYHHNKRKDRIFSIKSSNTPRKTLNHNHPNNPNNYLPRITIKKSPK